ncbi:MAG: translocation/assembly module TamB [Prevotella sp.]|nr:translocation/assembly module TamB [Prevotella sp.]
MKILKYIFNITLWTILGLYIVFFLAFSIPAVQEYAAQRVAGLLAGKLGTSVRIERLEYGLPGHLTLYHVDVRDQQGEPMLQARRLSVHIDLLPLFDGKVSISTAQLFGMQSTLYRERADSPTNFQFVLDSLASRDTTGSAPLDLRINSLIVRRSSIRYDQRDAAETPQQLNPSHLHVTDFSTHLILKVLTEDSLNLNVKRLSCKEKSGLQLNRLSFRFEGGRSCCKLEDFLLRLPGTDFQLGDIRATYRFRGDHFVTPSLAYSGSIKSSTVTLSDLSCLLPSLETFNSTLSLSSTFHGQGETLDVPALSVSSTTGDIGIDLGGHVNALRQSNPSWWVDIHDLALSAKTVDFISTNLQGMRVEVPEPVVRLGNIHLTGTASGRGLSEIATRSQLSSDAGNVSLEFSMDGQRAFSGSIDTQGFDLQRFLDDAGFGMLAARVAFNGAWPASGLAEVHADGQLQQLDYNGYSYHNIDVKGLYSPSDIHGMLSIDDPNIGFSVEGAVSQVGAARQVKLTAAVHDLSPKAIHLTDKWDDARFSATLHADFSGTSPNDAVGYIDIGDLTLASPSQHYQLQRLHIASGFEHGIHYASMDSDFGDAAIRGEFDYQTLVQSITNFVAERLPTLSGLPRMNASTHNNFTVNANIRKSDWIEHLLQVPLHLTEPVRLQGMVSDGNDQIVVECLAPSFSYRDGCYAKGRLSILSPLHTLQYEVSADKVDADGGALSLQAMGSVYDNQLTATLLWDNHAEASMSGNVTAKATFGHFPDGHQVTHVDIASSHMNINNSQWTIAPCRITYHKEHVDVSGFAIRHGEQFLTLDGTASANSSDSIAVRLRDIDIEYVLDLVGFDAVDFNGLATGSGSVRQVFGNLEADARLSVSGFQFEHGRMGTLSADVVWNKEAEQIDIHATCDDGPDAMTYVDGYVSPKRDYIDLGIRAAGTHLDFAHSFTQSFMSSVEGHVEGAVRLAGPLDAINLTGDLVLNGRMHVSTLGCDYELRDDSLHLTHNEITFVSCPVYDAYGKQGIVTGGIHHEDLTKLTFDIYVDAQELLAYDFRDFGQDTFYGTVFANGTIGIHGREGSVAIEADVTPLANSVFVYNAAATEVSGEQEYIEWGHGTEPRSATAADSEAQGLATVADNEAAGMSSPSPREGMRWAPRSDLTLRLKINTTPAASIRLLMDPRTNDYITLRGTGDLQATYYNKGGFTMNGTYRVAEGTYGITIQDIIKKNFVFREGGTITFGGDPYDATLNLQAQHTVNGVSLSDLNVGRSFANTVRVNCLMNITGQPRQPIVDFDLEMPNVNSDEQQMVRSIINGEEEMNQQVVYLLAVGRFYPQGANNATEASEGGQSKTSLAMQSLLSGTLSGQINNVLNSVIKSNNWNFGANISTGDEGWNNAEYEGIITGRLLNNRLLINGQFGYRDNATTANPSFIGDFDIRYLLMPNGNLALKVYNQTNDRYFTRSSLNTQGIGLIMKKDFNGLRDLFGSKQRNKKRKKRSR